ncbi:MULTISPECIES: hypothetical protein, partial [unclassified Pseudomonas]|uniref:hypothetical protein n=1 Tax=unclassified Pseudomonas TaxID=196821 RepID=UPI0030D9FAAC
GFSRVVSVNQLKGWFHLFASGSATFGTLPIGEGRNFLGNGPHDAKMSLLIQQALSERHCGVTEAPSRTHKRQPLSCLVAHQGG